MIITEVEPRELGWVIGWTSKPWHETGDFAYALGGNAPYLVCRENGTLFETGSASPVEERIQAAERRLREQLES